MKGYVFCDDFLFMYDLHYILAKKTMRLIIILLYFIGIPVCMKYQTISKFLHVKL